MHVPDGYLSPETCAAFYAGMTPVWLAAGRRVTRVVKTRFVPLVALGAAYSFLVMMFNVPVPDGTTAHAVGAVLVAVLLGPWAAVIAVSVALAIQALLFGDGGVLAFGTNAFNMAFVMPVTGYAVYRLLAGRCPLTARRRAVAAGIGAYVGLNVAALCVAVELGLQPELFSTANGTPLYAPFPLWQTVPVMLLAHLAVAGVVELVLTYGVVSYLQRANVPVLRINRANVAGQETEPGSTRRAGWRWALVGLGAMTVLTPLGLLAGGGAFGEDAPADLDLRRYGLRAVPRGLVEHSTTWTRTVLDGYGFGSGRHPGIGYLVSAAVGVAAIAAIVAVGFAISRVLERHRRPEAPA